MISGATSTTNIGGHRKKLDIGQFRKKSKEQMINVPSIPTKSMTPRKRGKK